MDCVWNKIAMKIVNTTLLTMRSAKIVLIIAIHAKVLLNALSAIFGNTTSSWLMDNVWISANISLSFWTNPHHLCTGVIMVNNVLNVKSAIVWNVVSMIMLYNIVSNVGQVILFHWLQMNVNLLIAIWQIPTKWIMVYAITAMTTVNHVLVKTTAHLAILMHSL